MSGVFFSIVCPLFGCIIGNGMWISPLPAVLAAKKSGDLGELNPLPWVAGMVLDSRFIIFSSLVHFLSTCFLLAYLNCIAYVTYSVLLKDYFIFFANVPGLCLAVFYSLTAITVLARSNSPKDLQKMNIVMSVLIFGFFFFSVLGFASGMAWVHNDNERDKAATAFGLTGCCFSIMYYSAPVSTAFEVIRTRDASSLYAPMLVLNLTNAALWTFYGFIAINQPSVWVPNIIGGVLSIFLLTLVCIFPKKAKLLEATKSSTDIESESKISEPQSNPILDQASA